MSQPNIVFIHTDQQHHLAISAYGNANLSTPYMDRIIGEGVSFTRSYSANPVCCPARSSWYTGRMSIEHGVLNNGFPIDPNLPDLGQWLTQHTDYDCVYSGKWHVTGREVADSFDVIYGRHPYGELQDSGSARAGAQYIAAHAASGTDRPFFLSVGLLNPHDCCYVCGVSGNVGKYGLDPAIPDLPELPGNFDVDLLPDNARRRVGHWSDDDWRYYIYQCHRMTETVDAQIGLVYDTLEGHGLLDDTLFIFTADHGEASGHHRRILKGFFEEEAWAVPLAISHRGTISHTQNDTNFISGVDIPATICDYAGAPPLPDADYATSLRPFLEGESDISWRDHVIAENARAIAIRDEQYKSILYDTGQHSLYDLINDPLEKKNLATESGFDDAKNKHATLLADYANQIKPYSGPDRVEERDQIIEQRMATLKEGNVWEVRS